MGPFERNKPTHPVPPERHVPPPRATGASPFNIGTFSTPPEVMNPSLSPGGFSKPPPPGMEHPLRWQRGVGAVGVACTFGVGVWALIFADWGTGERETVMDPIRAWFAPYKAQLFGLSEHDKRRLALYSSSSSSPSPPLRMPETGTTAEPNAYQQRTVAADTEARKPARQLGELDAVERIVGRRVRADAQRPDGVVGRAPQVPESTAKKEARDAAAAVPAPAPATATAEGGRGCCVM